MNEKSVMSAKFIRDATLEEDQNLGIDMWVSPTDELVHPGGKAREYPIDCKPGYLLKPNDADHIGSPDQLRRWNEGFLTLRGTYEQTMRRHCKIPSKGQYRKKLIPHRGIGFMRPVIRGDHIEQFCGFISAWHLPSALQESKFANRSGPTCYLHLSSLSPNISQAMERGREFKDPVSYIEIQDVH